MNDGHCDPGLFCGWINFGHALPRCAKELQPANGRQPYGNTIYAIANIGFEPVVPPYGTGKVVICRAAAAATVPPPQAPILLVALDLSIRPNNFVALIHRAFKIRWRDPIIEEVDAHPIIEIDSHLDGVVSIDSIPRQPFPLSDCSKRHRLGFVIMKNEIDPVRTDICERVALLGPLESARRNFQRLLQVSGPVERLANALLDLFANAQVVRIETF